MNNLFNKTFDVHGKRFAGKVVDSLILRGMPIPQGMDQTIIKH